MFIREKNERIRMFIPVAQNADRKTINVANKYMNFATIVEKNI